MKGLLLRRRAEEILELVDKTEKELTKQDETVEGRCIHWLRRFSGGAFAAASFRTLSCALSGRYF